MKQIKESRAAGDQPDKNGILFSFSFDGQGGGKALSGDDISQTLKAKKLGWVHMDAGAAGTRGWLEREVSYLDHLIIDALLAEETRPRILVFEKGVLLILRGVNLNEQADPSDMVSVRIWADDERIITLRRRRLSSIQDIKEKLEHGEGPKNAADFLSALCTRLFERMEPVLQQLDEETDLIEEDVLDEPDTDLREKIIAIRKQAISLRRYIAPQKDVLSQVKSSELEWLDMINRRRLQESFDRVVRYTEDLDAIRERAQIVKDELANALSDKLNRNMYVLSVVAAVFLPLGFLTGLLGINVGGIPGTDNPQAFWIFSAILIAVVLLQVLIFKKLKWF